MCDGSLLLRRLAGNPHCYLRPLVSTRKPHLRLLLGCLAPHTAGEPPPSGMLSHPCSLTRHKEQLTCTRHLGAGH